MKKILLTFLGTLFLSGASLSQRWHESDIDHFIEECMNDGIQGYLTEYGAVEYCNCYVFTIMESYRYIQLLENLTEEEANATFGYCIFEVVAKEGDDILRTWDETAKTAFIKNCKEEMAGAGINLNIYCPCALEEVMILYPTPFKALVGITTDILDIIYVECVD